MKGWLPWSLGERRILEAECLHFTRWRKLFDGARGRGGIGGALAKTPLRRNSRIVDVNLIFSWFRKVESLRLQVSCHVLCLRHEHNGSMLL
jgi:hypothetical protein